MKKPKPSAPEEIVIPVRIPPDLQARAEEIAKKGRTTVSHVLRLSFERGLNAVDKMFDLPADVAA